MGALLGLSGPVLAARQKEKAREQPVTVVSTSHEVFYFKVRKELLGARVEIVDSYNRELGSTTVVSKRMLIDFIELMPDTYKIRVIKDGRIIEMQCVKTSLGLFEL